MFNIVGNCYAIADVTWPTAIWYCANVFNPLQGLFNFLIYIHPKVMNAKNKGGNGITWSQAFAKAFWSTGIERPSTENSRDIVQQPRSNRAKPIAEQAAD